MGELPRRTGARDDQPSPKVRAGRQRASLETPKPIGRMADSTHTPAFDLEAMIRRLEGGHSFGSVSMADAGYTRSGEPRHARVEVTEFDLVSQLHCELKKGYITLVDLERIYAAAWKGYTTLAGKRMEISARSRRIEEYAMVIDNIEILFGWHDRVARIGKVEPDQHSASH